MIGLLTVLVVLLGAYGLTKMDQELMPEIEFDGAFVVVSAGDMAAIEVERNITSPLEQNILGLDGVEEVLSTTTIGQTTLQVFIEKGRGDEVSKEIQTVTNSVTANVPGVTDVMAEQASMSSSYEFFMDVSGGDMDEMTTFAEEVLEPRLEELPEVRDVALMGVQEYEMVVELDKEKLNEHALDSSQVISMIQQANAEATLGELTGEEEEASLRWESKLSSIEQVEEIAIPTETGFIQLDEIGKVSLEPLESTSSVWKEGSKDFIFVQVGRTAEVTQVEMAAAIREEVQNIRDEGLIIEFDLNELVAQADYVEDSINGITDNIIIGGIIAIIVLLLYLRNVRATIIIGISIPTSLLLTFITMWLLDYSFNMLTLIALGLGVGMMVDSAIVILESIYKQKELGYNALDSVLKGTKEVASAVIASTLTTIVVFLPIGLMGGDVGQFMVMLAKVVAITLVSSLLVAFTIIPTLAQNFLKTRKTKKVKEGKLIKFYENFIAWVVNKKRRSIAMIAVFILMFVGSMFLVFKIPMTIMPDMLNRFTEIIVDLETGIDSDEKNEVAMKISETSEGIEDVETSYIMDDGTSFYMLINMTKDDEITREQKEVNEEILRSLRELSEGYPINNVQGVMSISSGQPVQIQIKGEDYDQLQSLAKTVTQELNEIEGIVGITNSIERTSVEKVVEMDKEEMEDKGVTDIQLRASIEEAFLHMPIGEVTLNDDTVPLVVKWDEEVVKQKDILDLSIPTVEGEERLSTFIDLVSVDNPNEISRIDGERYITVSADLEDTDLGTANREVQRLINEFDPPNGYTISIGGEIEEQQELIFDLIMIFVVSVFLVYLVMAVQFNHLAHPIIVLSTIPMAFVGVVVGLFATQRELSIMSGMGIILLIGIVLNNAILLIDRTNQLRRLGFTAIEAIVQAGKDRIRPIFMTTFTTVGGMLPLALATGTTGNYQAPMATAIIFGIMFATLITLVLIPAVYRTFNAIGNGFGRLFKRNKTQEIVNEQVS